MIKFIMVGPDADSDSFEDKVQDMLNDGYELHGSVLVTRSSEYPDTDYFLQAMIKRKRSV